MYVQIGANLRSCFSSFAARVIRTLYKLVQRRHYTAPPGALALMRGLGIMRYGARFTSLVDGFVLQKGKCRRTKHSRSPSAAAARSAGLVQGCYALQRMQNALFYSIERNPSTAHPQSALRSNNGKEAQRNNLAAVHFCTFQQTIHSKKRAPYRTISKHRTSAERGQENSAPTSPHLLHNILMTYAAREEGRLPPSLLQKPSFSSPPSTALFFFSAPGEKEEGGASPQKRYECIPQQKNGIPGKGSPLPKRALLPKRSPGKRAGRAPRGISCHIRGQSPPRGRKARPAGRYFFPSSVFTRSVAAWNTCSAL